MKNRYIVLILFLLFLLEGTLFHWLIPSEWQFKLSLAPHFTLVAVLIVSMQRNRLFGLVLGLVFGLVHDIVYASPMIGPHAFSMAFAAYAAGTAAKRMKLSMAMTFFIISVCIAFYDVTIFSLYRLFRITFMTYGDMLSQHLAPSLLFNLLFAVMIYVPARRWLEMSIEKREEES